MNQEQLLIPIVVILIIAFWVRHFYKVWQMKRWDYEWYRREFPKLVHNGRVSCYRCNSTDLRVERLMNHTYMRTHHCGQCGTTLYYSRE